VIGNHLTAESRKNLLAFAQQAKAGNYASGYDIYR